MHWAGVGPASFRHKPPRCEIGPPPAVKSKTHWIAYSRHPTSCIASKWFQAITLRMKGPPTVEYGILSKRIPPEATPPTRILSTPRPPDKSARRCLAVDPAFSSLLASIRPLASKTMKIHWKSMQNQWFCMLFQWIWLQSGSGGRRVGWSGPSPSKVVRF